MSEINFFKGIFGVKEFASRLAEKGWEVKDYGISPVKDNYHVIARKDGKLAQMLVEDNNTVDFDISIEETKEEITFGSINLDHDIVTAYDVVVKLEEIANPSWRG